MERMIATTATRASLALFLVLAAPGAVSAQVQEARPVKVERVKPQRPKLPTLRFLRENRDFLRGRMDALSQVPLETEDEGVPMDERFLRFGEMGGELDAAGDTLSATARADQQRDFLNSVNELAGLEGELDLLDSLLTDQEGRIRELEEDFLARQETALLIVVRGGGGTPLPSSLTLTDEAGDTVRTSLAPEDRASLAGGGILQIYHEFVEPREQTWELVTAREEAGSSPPVYLTLEPVRDQLNVLELDLDPASPSDASPDLAARTWVQRTVSSRPEGEGPTVR